MDCVPCGRLCCPAGRGSGVVRPLPATERCSCGYDVCVQIPLSCPLSLLSFSPVSSPLLLRPLPSVMSLPSLPAVLAQSIAHFLTTKERLALARCSQRNRILAESPFAWISAEPITLKFDGHALPSAHGLRFIPIDLVWLRDVGPAAITDRVTRILAFADRSQLVSLQLSETLDDAPLTEILQAPSLQRLQTLKLALRSHTRRHIELVRQLPLLATLTIWSPLAKDEAGLLTAAPSLTDVTISDPYSGCVSSVLRCSKLRRLAASGMRAAELLACSQEPAGSGCASWSCL